MNRGKRLALVAALAIGSLVAASPLPAADRGISIKVKDKAGTPVALYEESHALVVGISDYTNGWPRLRGVEEDVPAVKEALEKQGFTVTVVMNPDREGLDRAFRAFINRYGLKPDNRLLFYFAGHGHSMRLGYGGMMGYLVGSDAPNPRADKAGFRGKALSMRVVETYARNIESKHALFLFDACFSGSVFDATRAIPDAIAVKTGRPVRQFITSGTAEQTVPDKSVFRRQFVAALDGEGDLDRDGYVTGAELGQFLETTVANYTRRSQTPQYGKLRDPLLDKGDFVFALPGEAGAEVPSAAGGLNAEVLFWQSISASDNPADFEAYLERFPEGIFSRLAQIRIDALRPSQVAIATPAEEPVDEPEPSRPNPAEVREAQRLLTELGYDPGPVDAVMGRRTRAAIENFQRSHGQTVDGEVSEELLTALRASRKQFAAAGSGPTPRTSSPARPSVGVYPKRYKPGDIFKDCAECPKMVVVPAGSFMMGSPTTEEARHDDEGPRDRVTISRPFAVGKYEVTQAEWRAVMGNNPSLFKGDRNPVEQVSWNDAKEFVRHLSAKTGKAYRLLSEAEWEYVARAGTTTPFHTGKRITTDQANFNGNYTYGGSSKGVYRRQTLPVGSFRPNRFGLYDVHGNVWEWVEDCWHNSYRGAPTDSGAWTTGGNCSLRVLRGGAWSYLPRGIRSAIRHRELTDYRSNSLGFRVSRKL